MAKMIATREYQAIIDAKDKRIRELEEQLSKQLNNQPKAQITPQLQVPVLQSVEHNTKNKSNQENDFTIKYDKKSNQYTGIIDSEDIKVEFTHKGHSNVNSMLAKVIGLISSLTI
ncbi:hypothetical protein D5b_00265 [Faustovirus]|nr:hypothetical protein D5b_00265 [Faustovirus]